MLSLWDCHGLNGLKNLSKGTGESVLIVKRSTPTSWSLMVVALLSVRIVLEPSRTVLPLKPRFLSSNVVLKIFIPLANLLNNSRGVLGVK